MAKIKMPKEKITARKFTFEEIFSIFLNDAAARGLADKTLETYRHHLHCISLYFDITYYFDFRLSVAYHGIIENQGGTTQKHTIARVVKSLQTLGT